MATLAYYAAPKKFRTVWLLLSSYYFYIFTATKPLSGRQSARRARRFFTRFPKSARRFIFLFDRPHDQMRLDEAIASEGVEKFVHAVF